MTRSDWGRDRRVWMVATALVAAAAFAVLTWFWKESPPDPTRLWESAEADYRAGRFEAAEAALARLDRRGRRPPNRTGSAPCRLGAS